MSEGFELLPNDTVPHAVIELHGEVDATNAAEFERQLSAQISAGPVVLDLSRAAYFDSAGFEVLDRLVATGAVTVAIAPTSLVRRSASLMGLECHDTVDQAMDALTASRYQ